MKKPKQTQFEKIKCLMRYNPNTNEIKTALKYVGDDALIREIQRRGIWPEKESPALLCDDDLIAEYKEREINLIAQKEIRKIIDSKDWEELEEFYYNMI